MAKFNPRARHRARQLAVQAIYQWQVAATDLLALEAQFFTDYDMKKVDDDYLKNIMHGVPRAVEMLDQLLTPHLLDFSLSELNPVELAILRIACFEMAYVTDVPVKVIINEALELTKHYGSVEGYKFVNGVLDKLARLQRAQEL